MTEKKTEKQMRIDEALDAVSKAFYEDGDVILVARTGETSQVGVIQGSTKMLTNMFRSLAEEDEDFKRILERAVKPRRGPSTDELMKLLEMLMKLEEDKAEARKDPDLEKLITDFLTSAAAGKN